MPIPIEVHYITSGKSKKKTRNVIGVICPTALAQCIALSKPMPIYVEMGDVMVDWEETSAGFEMMHILSSEKHTAR